MRAAASPSLRRRDPSWDYAGKASKRLTHGLHPYPAMMIPHVAARLIELLSQPGDLVLDPFCGSGSVLVEAIAAGRRAIGVDLNPLAVLIARAKTTPVPAAALTAAIASVEAALPRFLADPPPPPPVPRLDFWFKPDVIRALAALRAAIFAAHEPARAVLQATFSEVVRLASNARSSEFKLHRYPPERLVRHQPDPVALFRARAARNAALLATFAPTAPAEVWLADSRQPLPGLADSTVDAVITSPPYGDSRTTVAYGQFSRLSAQWLGIVGDRDLDPSLLGGARTRAPIPSSPHLEATLAAIACRDRRRASDVAAFYVDMAACLAEIARVLRPGGLAALVVGNRRVKGVQIPTDLILADLAVPLGLLPREVIIRRIPTKRLPSRNSPSNIPGTVGETMSHEHILILERGAPAAPRHAATERDHHENRAPSQRPAHAAAATRQA
ncbi:MAG: DNA methyltransferase [Chloroflexota bacterium]|nr:DNA methyltransferase [Dehalococcoidia bacterium]MDW8252516.1 DNA methyltransferase [Chloroflexota bacterium]